MPGRLSFFLLLLIDYIPEHCLVNTYYDGHCALLNVMNLEINFYLMMIYMLMIFW